MKNRKGDMNCPGIISLFTPVDYKVILTDEESKAYKSANCLTYPLLSVTIK